MTIICFYFQTLMNQDSSDSNSAIYFGSIIPAYVCLFVMTILAFNSAGGSLTNLKAAFACRKGRYEIDWFCRLAVDVIVIWVGSYCVSDFCSITVSDQLMLSLWQGVWLILLNDSLHVWLISYCCSIDNFCVADLLYRVSGKHAVLGVYY